MSPERIHASAMKLGRKRAPAVAGIASVALVAILLTFLPQTGGLSNGQCKGLPGCPFSVEGDIFIATAVGGGMITLTVTNYSNYPLSNITFSGITPNVDGLTVFTPFACNGRVVSSANLLQFGGNSTGYYSFTWGGSVSTTYTLVVTATMTNGQVVTWQASAVSYSWS